MFIAFILSFLIQTIIFHKIAKQGIYLAVFLAVTRLSVSYFYTDVFIPNDITNSYLPTIQRCNPINILNFQSIASFLYCNNIFNNVRGINAIYGCIGTFAMGLLLNLGQRIYFDFYKKLNHDLKSLENNNYYLKKLKSIKFAQLIILFDPIGLTYTSAFGKDVFLFALFVSFFYFLFYKSWPIGIFSLLMGLVCLNSRPYIFAFVLTAAILSKFLPQFKIKSYFQKISINLPLRFSFKSPNIIFILGILPLIIFLLNIVLSFYVDDLSQLMDFLDEYGTSYKGGSLNFSSDAPFFLKYIYFWILPLPVIQSGPGAIVFGISTVFYLFLVINIFKNGINLKRNILKFLLSIILIFSLIFSYISYNSGLTSRYKFTTCLASLYIVFVFSNIEKVNKYINNSSLNGKVSGIKS